MRGTWFPCGDVVPNLRVGGRVTVTGTVTVSVLVTVRVRGSRGGICRGGYVPCRLAFWLQLG